MPASAADLPTKGPVYKAAPAVYNWTGLYGGVNLGYAWDPNYVLTSTQSGTVTLPLEPHGVFGGVQLGYNLHIARHWVLGVEADWQLSAIDDSVSLAGPINASVDLSSFATIRGRIGYAADRTLIYFTGGVAFGKFDLKADSTFAIGTGAATFNEWKTGYVLGAGIERAFGNGWSFKAEYQYLNFAFDAAGVERDANQIVIGVFNIRAEPEVHSVRVGINRRFSTY